MSKTEIGTPSEDSLLFKCFAHTSKWHAAMLFTLLVGSVLKETWLKIMCVFVRYLTELVASPRCAKLPREATTTPPQVKMVEDRVESSG